MTFALFSGNLVAKPMQREKERGVFLATFYLAITIAAIFYLSSFIDDRDPGADSNQNLRMAYHLATSGMMAYDQGDEATAPTMRREPLPVVVLAATMLLHPGISTDQSLAEMTSGESLVILKHVNLFWVVLLFGGIFALTWAISQSFLWRVIVPTGVLYFVVFGFLLNSPGNVNRVLTEIEISTLMAWAALLMLLLVRSPTIGKAVALGAVLGCAALVKASFLHISLCAFAMLALTLLYVRWQAGQGRAPSPSIDLTRYTGVGSLRRLATTLLASVAVFFVTLAPWAVRNFIHFDQLTLIDRGGQHFYFRLLQSEQPFSATFYMYSPGEYQELLEPWLGYSQEDREVGGKLEAWSRGEDSLKRNRIDIMRSRMEEATGEWPSRLEMQGWLFRDAVKRYAQDPLWYVASVGLFGYRGSFSTSRAFPRLSGDWPAWVRAIPLHLSFLMTVNFVVLAVGSLFRRRPETFMVFVIPFGYFLFLAMFSHNIFRYTLPVGPFIALALAVSLAYAARHAGSAVSAVVSNERLSAQQGEAAATGR